MGETVMTLQFPAHDDVVFKHAPLTEVVSQIRFPPILSLLNVSGIIGFQEALRTDYPDLSVDQETDISVSPGSIESQQSAPVWRLKDKENHWTVSLTADFIALSTTKYLHFEDFASRLLEILNTLERTLAPGRSTRIGMRKINLLNHPKVKEPKEWHNFIRHELLGFVGAEGLPNSTQSFSIFNFLDEDNSTLSVRHGINPQDISTYALDLDYWTESSFSLEASQAIVKRLKSYSDSITSLFHWCLKKDMKEYLEPRLRTQE